MRVGFFIVAALAGCSFEADYGGTRFRCESTADCPDRTACIDDLCQLADDPADPDATPGAPDAPACLASDPCPVDWIEMEGGCYLVVAEPADWETAEAACEADCAHLVVLGEETIDVDEHFVLHDLTEDLTDVWIGVTDRAEEDQFRWVTGALLDLADNDCFWKAGEPDDEGDKDCAVQAGTNTCGDWTTEPCGTAHAYVCERDGKPADPAAY